MIEVGSPIQVSKFASAQWTMQRPSRSERRFEPAVCRTSAHTSRWAGWPSRVPSWHFDTDCAEECVFFVLAVYAYSKEACQSVLVRP